MIAIARKPNRMRINRKRPTRLIFFVHRTLNIFLGPDNIIIQLQHQFSSGTAEEACAIRDVSQCDLVKVKHRVSICAPDIKGIGTGGFMVLTVGASASGNFAAIPVNYELTAIETDHEVLPAIQIQHVMSFIFADTAAIPKEDP